eukprot:gb/GECG01014551.1/.p1 GENE.gb/GECG01014551.1/~~gb/GECG01014551.1/.p1  ORF type:complete len:167 (+),score=20.82 gb/GECG01014551.1/:1-501(+)
MNRLQIALKRTVSRGALLARRTAAPTSWNARAAAAMETTRVQFPTSGARCMATDESSTDNIVHIHSTDEYIQQVQNSTKLVAYYTAKWCGPCRMFGPVYERLASEYGDRISFLKIDVDENEQLAANAGIQAVPTFQLFNGGKKIDTVQGADKDAVTQKIESLIEQA